MQEIGRMCVSSLGSSIYSMYKKSGNSSAASLSRRSNSAARNMRNFIKKRDGQDFTLKNRPSLDNLISYRNDMLPKTND